MSVNTGWATELQCMLPIMPQRDIADWDLLDMEDFLTIHLEGQTPVTVLRLICKRGKIDSCVSLIRLFQIINTSTA